MSYNVKFLNFEFFARLFMERGNVDQMFSNRQRIDPPFYHHTTIFSLKGKYKAFNIFYNFIRSFWFLNNAK